MNDVNFNRGEGGLGRALAGEDHISSFVSYVAAADTVAASAGTVKVIYSLAQAEAEGILANSAVLAIKQMHYALKTCFQANPKSVLYVAFYVAPEVSTVLTPDLTKIIDVQRFAEGKIRQMAVMNILKAFSVGQIVTLQSACDILEAEHKPLSVLYTADFSANDDLGAMPDLRAQDAKNVSVVIGADGAGIGAAASVVDSKAYSCIGLALGALSVAKVNENIGWIEKFNVAKNAFNEFDVPALIAGGGASPLVLVKTLAPAAIQALVDKGYLLLVKQVGIAGTYFEDTPTCIAVTSDYAFIENNRTIDKAVRGIRTFLLPNLKAPLYVNGDGTLTEDTIALYRNDALRALEQMERATEISAKAVTIDPAQDVLSSSKIILTVTVVPAGVARNIEVNIGFAVKLV